MQDTEHIEMKPMKSTHKGFDVWDQNLEVFRHVPIENSQRSFGQRKFVKSTGPRTIRRCHWHGCRKCFPCERSETKTPLTKQSMEELYVVTKKKRADYTRTWLWLSTDMGHDFASRLNSNKRLKIFAENHEIEERLDPRHAFFVSKSGLREVLPSCASTVSGEIWATAVPERHSFFHESEADKFFQIVSDPTKVVENFHIVSNDTIQLEWSTLFQVPLLFDVKTNIFIAIFTTMWARLKLYVVLDMLDERVLYTDTDRCIYVSRRGKPEPPLGNYLGTHIEIPANEEILLNLFRWTEKLCLSKPKIETCKVKGFTLNFTNSNIVNFNSIKDMITCNRDICKTLTNPTKICRLPNQRKIFSREEKKEI
ncbi:unnamed protein product [Mytilus coruscus]|uniref:DNA-directed DNA polymerase n=1 Tax=Mytilus coruscus TaxID=42192 RepID=A0A6J8D4A9_MYTCO|nr:unnamed protein product [Mytilus coruscus]